MQVAVGKSCFAKGTVPLTVPTVPTVGRAAIGGSWFQPAELTDRGRFIPDRPGSLARPQEHRHPQPQAVSWAYHRFLPISSHRRGKPSKLGHFAPWIIPAEPDRL